MQSTVDIQGVHNTSGVGFTIHPDKPEQSNSMVDLDRSPLVADRYRHDAHTLAMELRGLVASSPAGLNKTLIGQITITSVLLNEALRFARLTLGQKSAESLVIDVLSRKYNNFRQD
jgi:hypothetical protein